RRPHRAAGRVLGQLVMGFGPEPRRSTDPGERAGGRAAAGVPGEGRAADPCRLRPPTPLLPWAPDLVGAPPSLSGGPGPRGSPRGPGRHPSRRAAPRGRRVRVRPCCRKRPAAGLLGGEQGPAVRGSLVSRARRRLGVGRRLATGGREPPAPGRRGGL